MWLHDKSLHSLYLIGATSAPLAILALYIPPLFIVQSKRMTEWEERVKQTVRQGGDAAKTM